MIEVVTTQKDTGQMAGLQVFHGKPGMGKTSFTMQHMATAIAGNVNINIFIEDVTLDHYRLKRTPPEAHNVALDRLGHLGVGVGRAGQHLEARNASVLGYLYHEFLTMGAPCQLIRIKFNQHERLPGYSASRYGVHKVVQAHMDLLVFQCGVVDWMGNTWASIHDAMVRISGQRRPWYRLCNIPRSEITKACDHAAVASMRRSGFKRVQMAGEELKLAWLESQTPKAVTKKMPGRL